MIASDALCVEALSSLNSKLLEIWHMAIAVVKLDSVIDRPNYPLKYCRPLVTRWFFFLCASSMNKMVFKSLSEYFQ